LGELYRYRDLIRTLVARDLKVRYRRSAIGFLWTMLHPLMMMLVLALVFSEIFRFNAENYPVYALSGIVFWNFFSQSLTASMNSLRGNAALVTKLPVPKAVFPLATVISGLMNLIFALVPLFLIMVVTGHRISPAIAFLPISIAIAAAFTLGAGLLLSPLAAFFSDTVELVGILLTLLFYLTPVFYPMAIVPDRLRWVVEWNPARMIIDVFRLPIHEGLVPPLSLVVMAAAISAIVLVAGATMFRRTSDRIAFYV
jgi:ABC-2 type transport system permease protein